MGRDLKKNERESEEEEALNRDYANDTEECSKVEV